MTILSIPSRIPSFIDCRVINEDGTWSDTWKLIIQSLLQGLTINFGNEGVVVPSLTASQIALLQHPPTQIFTLIGDTTNNKLKVSLNDGTFHEVVTV